MMEDIEVVITTARARTILPECLGVGVGLMLQLVERGVWKELADRLRVQRSGGYVGIDAVLFLLLFFSAGPRWGLKAFGRRVGPLGAALAGLGGRKSLPTQSAMSRLLGAMEQQHVRAVGPWMLWDATDAAGVAGHAAMQTFDANGEGWHLVDYDLTKTVLRKRGLPEGEELPPPRRHSDGFAEPGHPGHKRGEVQVSRAALQHAGSGLWLDARVHPGNGDGLQSLASAIAATGRLAQQLHHPRERVLMRMDGEFGYVPALTLLEEAGQPALTRLNRLHLLDQPDVRQRIVTGTWHRVPDSGSGPIRSALDLGTVTLRPGKETLRPDGTCYEPLDVRVIISRLPREGTAEHGKVIDGWQYELFAALRLPVDAWPAHEAVAAYFGRGAQENRFAQEDREFKLDRVFSYNLAGQELACLVGLMVWNLQVVHGAACERPLPERRPAPFTAPVVDERPVPAATWAPATPPALATAQAPGPAPAPADPTADLEAVLAEVRWDQKLAKRTGWAWDAQARRLCCPAGQPTELTHVQPDKGRGTRNIVFRAPVHACRGCPQRDGCLASVRVDQPKVATFSVPVTLAQRLAAMLPDVQFARRKQQSARALATPPLPGRPPRQIFRAPLPVDGTTRDTPPGLHAVSHAQFLPAAARQAFRRAFDHVDFQVDLRRAVEPPKHHLLATSPARRQHRRATWAQRLQWYALPAGSDVRVTIQGGASLSAAFPWAGLRGERSVPGSMQ